MTTTDKILVPAAEAARLLSMGKSTFWREVSKARPRRQSRSAGSRAGGWLTLCALGSQPMPPLHHNAGDKPPQVGLD